MFASIAAAGARGTCPDGAAPHRLAAHERLPPPSRIGLALAGGGPLGAIYEVGALCALDEALRGVDFNALDGYVGVSAGSFIAAGLANGISPRQMCRAFIENDPDAGFVMSPTAFVHPAWAEYLQRLAALPGLLAQAGWRYAFGGRMLPGPPAARAGSAAPAQAALTQARSRSASERGEWTVTPPNDRP